MDEYQGIYWHQGMFMQPQHFQMTDLHGQFRLKPLMDHAVPHFWGVGALELAQFAPTDRKIEVRSARLLFPDHSYIEYPGNAAIAPRAFDAAWFDSDRPLTVYLGLKKLGATDNVSVVGDLDQAAAAGTRYASLTDPAAVADLYTAGPNAEIATLIHVVKIFFESELDNLGAYDLIPVARLVRDGDTIKLADGFIPPCYTLGGSASLLARIKDIRDELAGRTRQLQTHKSPRESAGEFDSNALVFLLALRSLSRVCPYLYHLTEDPAVHPWLVYGALRQLVGELSTFSDRFNMLGETDDGTPGVPPYDHLDLDRCFARTHALLSRLLNEISIGPEYLANLEYREGRYVGELPPNFFDRRNRFYLVVRAEGDPQRTIDGVLREARLAADDDVAGLIAHALPGLELIHLPSAPQGLPRRPYAYYFRIEQVSQLWDAVEHQCRIALQWPDAPQDMKAEIVVLRR
jgi:type VI secretion system protein ImpJ